MQTPEQMLTDLAQVISDNSSLYANGAYGKGAWPSIEVHRRLESMLLPRVHLVFEEMRKFFAAEGKHSPYTVGRLEAILISSLKDTLDKSAVGASAAYFTNAFLTSLAATDFALKLKLKLEASHINRRLTNIGFDERLSESIKENPYKVPVVSAPR